MMNGGGGGGQKKRGTRIEPFRHRVETDPKFFDKSWRKLHDAIREIYNHNASGLSFEELYRLVHTPTTHPAQLTLLAIAAFRAIR